MEAACDLDGDQATAAVEVRGLTKSYGPVAAVRSIDFTVRTGEIFGLLGTNGAGKTTTIEILEGYLARDEGHVSVLGVDPKEATPAWRDRIGLVLQESELDPIHTVTETLTLFAGFFASPRSVEETMKLVGLSDLANSRIGKLSGGQKRRVDVALGLIGAPQLLFLDEPTTGFDPSARREFWEMLLGLRATGTSMILTTHYMEEAQALCDRVAIMREGAIVASGTPTALIAGVGATRIEWSMPRGELAHFEDVGIRPTETSRIGTRSTYVLDAGNDPQALLTSLLIAAKEAGISLSDLQVNRPTLDDVFLAATEIR